VTEYSGKPYAYRNGACLLPLLKKNEKIIHKSIAKSVAKCTNVRRDHCDLLKTRSRSEMTESVNDLYCSITFPKIALKTTAKAHNTTPIMMTSSMQCLLMMISVDAIFSIIILNLKCFINLMVAKNMTMPSM